MTKNTQKITATRDGITRKFSLAAWNRFPTDKYGWVAEVENVPPAVTASMTKANKAAKPAQSGDPLADK